MTRTVKRYGSKHRSGINKMKKIYWHHKQRCQNRKSNINEIIFDKPTYKHKIKFGWWSLI